MTPEAKVKKRVCDILKTFDAYFFKPATGGYGKSGVPDIVACIDGQFIGIECKAKGGKLSALQAKNLEDIHEADGIALIIDESNLGSLEDYMREGESNIYTNPYYLAMKEKMNVE